MATAASEEVLAGEGFTEKETAGDLEGEFIDPAEGLLVQGKLKRAFATDGEYGIQAAYALDGQWRTKEGTTGEGVILIGEKAFFRDAIRDEKLGSSLRVLFTERVALEKKGKKTGQTMWRGKFASKGEGTGKTVRATLAEWYAKSRRVATPAPAAEQFPDVPF